MKNILKEEVYRINELMSTTEEDEGLGKYMDSTYLKTPEQAGIGVEETDVIIFNTIKDAIEHNMKLVMIRPEYVKTARESIDNQKANVLVGTVIGFPNGDDSLGDKLDEAIQAIEDGVDELDFGVEKAKNVFVKTSTGFFTPEDGSPGGATIDAVSIMSQNAGPLKVKASGGIYSKDDVLAMVNVGASRIGTSAAKEIMLGKETNKDY